MQQNKKLRAALKYYEMGFSIIPTKADKKPYIKSWKQYQAQRADKKQIREWWGKWPNAGPAVVCGEISGVNVLDVDTAEGWENLNENFLDESFLTPISKTPGGGYHIMFDYKPGLSNGVRVLPGTDLKTNGGYAKLPPSDNGKGKVYAWLPELHILKVKPAPMPDFLFSVLEEGSAAGYASSLERAYINKEEYTRTGPNIDNHNKTKQKHNKAQQNVTKRNITFKEPGRDDTLFHLANCLVKGGMPPQEIEIYIDFIARNCTPPFPEKEIPIKIKSAIERSENRDRGLTQEIREWISVTKRNFSVTFLWNELEIVTKRNKAKVRTILSRFVQDGLIEKTDQAGFYRVIQTDCEPEDWQNACTDTVKLWLPFGLDKMAMIPSGSIITVAGEPNAGKTAALMNIAKENRHDWKVHYFSSEMGRGAFKRRMDKFKDVTSKQLSSIKLYPRSDNFADVIKSGENNLNIIDFLEMYENFYLVSKHLADIHKKLDNAIAIVALQKSPGQDVGRGGSFSIEKPVLSLSLSSGKATIAKLKEWSGDFNPNKMQYNFKLVDGCRFIKTQSWRRPIE